MANRKLYDPQEDTETNHRGHRHRTGPLRKLYDPQEDTETDGSAIFTSDNHAAPPHNPR